MVKTRRRELLIVVLLTRGGKKRVIYTAGAHAVDGDEYRDGAVHGMDG